jgi:hypothetical protein
MARQLVKSTVNLDLMMLAGQKPNSGAMIGALAGVLGEALDTGNKAKGDREKADLVKLQEKGEAERAQQDQIENAGDMASKGLEGLGADLTGEIKLKGFGDRGGLKNRTGSVEVGPGEFGLVQDSGAQEFNGGGRLPKYQVAYGKMSKTQKDSWDKKAGKGRSGYDEYEKQQLNLPVDQVAEKEKIRQYSETQPPGFVYDENNPKHVQGYEGSSFNTANPISPNQRQKDNSPFERRQVRSSRQSFNSPDAQSFNANVNAAGKEPVGSRDTSSQYTKGKTFVEKRRTIQMHSSLGELGQAAAEGWNISVERDNYEKQIEADLKDFRNDEWKAAGEEADKNALFDKGFVDAMGSYKTAYGQAQSLKDPKQRATALATIETKMGEIKRENAKVQKHQAFFKENYDNINLNLLKPEQKDLMLAAMGRGGDQIGFVLDEGGNFTIAGKTKNDTPMRYSPADMDKLFANLPMKRDFYEESFSISKALKDEKYQIKEIDANGIKTTKNVPFEKFEKQIAGQVEAAIFADGDKSGKGIASRMPAFQGKNGLRAWEEGMSKPEFLENGEPNPQHPHNIMRKNMTEAIYNDMGGYEAARDESVTSMYTNQQAEKSRIAKENREKNRTNNDSRTTLDNYNEYLDNAFGAYGSEGIEITQGNLEYLKGLPGVSDVQYVPAVFGNDKTMISKPTLTLLDKGGSPIIDKVDLTDEETARNIMLNYMGEKKFKPATRDTKTGGYNGAQVDTQTDHQKLTNQYAPK